MKGKSNGIKESMEKFKSILNFFLQIINIRTALVSKYSLHFSTGLNTLYVIFYLLFRQYSIEEVLNLILLVKNLRFNKVKSMPKVAQQISDGAGKQIQSVSKSIILTLNHQTVLSLEKTSNPRTSSIKVQIQMQNRSTCLRTHKTINDYN